MVDELNIFAGDEAPAVPLDLRHPDAAVQLRHGVLCAVRPFVLPGMINPRRSLDLLIVQHHFFLALVLNRVLRPGAQVHEQNLVLPVPQLPAVIIAAPFILIQNPEGDADVRRDKQLAGQDDDGFNLVILDQLLTDRQGVAVAQRAVGQQESPPHPPAASCGRGYAESRHSWRCSPAGSCNPPSGHRFSGSIHTTP